MYKAATDKWAQKADEKMEEKGTKGSLTKAAHSAGYSSPIEYAHHILASKDASTKMKRKANFAVNINK